ncbi:2-octaprenyl-6-methoxyphenol hydroxylase /2-octaprenyl-3-methyl-6-methoxy-1,4-benzoquinol hydroxylase [Rhodobacter aestuarii]|uniref:2-octaprenyl-6-methoxyphenol hydroxylase /2-octaprenyl-3-methyl-6-methoxy-1,4-benzoquinol hydroxylase n=1 Tax=Rhodobacter aestuarii TaxID=453582 RepID=A0A1N7K9Q6_9RHOB|nr:UbiH/UbiF/VisC/COQ6 family ubiquinone biosynthesis hydroxylase [Rhodobacter aestuarii]PTV95796.1 2-octaprenyl-6-methoxyphenol hydroxylase /2-octaprenyl-3-methyl-6-methoxy-1,4-benzoquinol hydroxylase [Rhodobacter aestuarii]SIS58326.1 2-octaprenyl-6-methoxyphenol hydroxylase /2-octaprenyl-3-methyl-6-methoxy-1,4-benzoquinol hydroxylase [Rhodobacter aestuarii]
MTQDSDVLIAGGGLNGPALALALAQAGLSVTVIDAAPATRRAEDAFDGRAYALALGSQKLLTALGLWPAVAAKAQPINDVKAFDGRPGEGVAPFFLHFDSRELDQKPVGYMLEDRFLYRALMAAVEANPQITLISETSVVAQEELPGGIKATLSDGRSLTGKLLVGADGRRSGVAERAGITREGWGYGQTALVAAIEHEKPHEGIAYQMFMTSGPLAILPLMGNRSSIVWSERDENAAVVQKLDDADFMALVRPRFGDFLGEIRLAGPRFSYPLNLTLAKAYVAPRVALIGDAAHGVHPIAGQGLNLGLRDVAALAEVVIEALRRGEDYGTTFVLDRYQTWRRFDSTAMALGMDAVNQLFSNDNPVLRAGRDLGMGIVQAIGPLRRGFMRQAAGIAGPLPKLMQGRPV